MNVYEKDVTPDIGFDNMKTVASVKDDFLRKGVEESFLEGSSPDMVKAELFMKNKPNDSLERLMSEKSRIEKTLDSLTVKLAKIEMMIEDLRHGS